MRSDVYTGAFTCVVSICMFYIASKLPEGMFGTLGAGFFPKIIFGTLAVCSCVLMVKAFIVHFAKNKTKTKTVPFPFGKYKIVLIAFVLFFLYVLGLSYLGFVIASMLFLPGLMWTLGPKTKASLVPIVLTSTGITAVTYISFTHFLQVFLPSGSLF
jgi:putative tricarboxylic transport membrane protein